MAKCSNVRKRSVMTIRKNLEKIIIESDSLPVVFHSGQDTSGLRHH